MILCSLQHPAGPLPAKPGRDDSQYGRQLQPEHQFHLEATYTDPDNEAPFAVQVIIDDTAYAMRETAPADQTYTDGKSYRYLTKLPAGSHTYYFRTTDTTSDEVATSVQTLSVVQASSVIDIAVSQAGYSAGDLKNAKLISDTTVTDATYEILDGTNVVYSGTMTYEGLHWNKHVYSIGFAPVTDSGNQYRVRSNQVYSYSLRSLRICGINIRMK